MLGYTDFELDTRWFDLEVSLCQWRETWRPNGNRYADGGDVFIPLPFGRTLWVCLFSPYIEYKRSGEGSLTPDPPHECAVDGCGYETDSYGAFLTHDERHHH